MGLVDVVDVIQPPGLGVHGTHAAQGRRGDGGTVVGVLATDDLLLVGLAEQVVIAFHQAQVGIVGLGAGVGEEHMVELRRGDLHQGPGQLHRRLVGALEEVVVKRQFLQLGVNGVADGLLAVTQVAAPQSGHAVEQLVAVGVVDVDVLGAGNDTPALLAVILQVGKRVQVVGLVQPLELARVDYFIHVLRP